MSISSRKPLTYLITSGETTDGNFAEESSRVLGRIRDAVDLGVSMIQIREKRLSSKLLFDLTVLAADAARGSGTKVLVNDRPDIALAAGADGVHLTAGSIPAAVIRNCFPADFLIGVSTHSFDELKNAAADGADLAVFGPVFATPGKGAGVGTDKLAAACGLFPSFPILGLGGIDESNFLEVLEAGASGIAAIRSLNDAGSLRRIMRSLR